MRELTRESENNVAKPHVFSLNTDIIIEQPVRGQALIVLNELRNSTEPRLAVDIDAAIAKTNPFKTRQDTLRVTLYYLIVFAKRGWVIKDKPQARENVVAEDNVEEIDERDATIDETDVQDAAEFEAELIGE